jgi:hypothetical protein
MNSAVPRRDIELRERKEKQSGTKLTTENDNRGVSTISTFRSESDDSSPSSTSSSSKTNDWIAAARFTFLVFFEDPAAALRFEVSISNSVFNAILHEEFTVVDI